jgi:hypothetical protein
MRRSASKPLLLCSFVLIMAACGGDGGQRAATETEPTRATNAPETARKVPEPGQPLSVGKYVTTEFEPALSFRVVDEGWEVIAPELPDLLAISRGEDFFAFMNPRQVYDPKRPAEQIAVPEPEDWVAWFQNHPYLETGKATSVTIGGISGVQFNMEASSAPRRFPERCGAPCVPAWPLSDGNSVEYPLGGKDRITIVEVAGETVIIDIGPPADAFDEFLPKAQEVLDTVEWEATS